MQPFLTYFVSAFDHDSPVRDTLVESLDQETRSMIFSIRDEWFAEGRAEGEARGRAEGEAEGEARGRAVGIARSLERLLAAKGLELTAEQRARVAGCTDETILQAWFDRAVTAAAPAQVFEG